MKKHKENKKKRKVQADMISHSLHSVKVKLRSLQVQLQNKRNVYV